MEEDKTRTWPFKIQFITLALIPLIIIAVNIPEDARESVAVLDKFFDFGVVAVGIVLLFAFPIGMIGFLNARKEKVPYRLNMATMVLGVANCIAGALFVGVVLMILFFTFVKGI